MAPTPKREPVSNVDIATYALAVLGGAERTMHSEHIAAKCFELAPTQFGWRLPEYRGWPDKYVAKTALDDAKKIDLADGAYALDVAKDGWRLTPTGARWFHENAQRIARALQVAPASVLPKKDVERFLRQMREKRMFREYLSTRRVDADNVFAFTDMLSCSPDASPEIIASKFRGLSARAEIVRDENVSAFLRACETTFEKLLKPNKAEGQTDGR
jgi:hypothetical protein